VADLEGVARRLLTACGQNWDPACLDFHHTQRPVRTASVAQVRQPIYTGSVARWKNYEQSLGSLFAMLGPEPGEPLEQVSSPKGGITSAGQFLTAARADVPASLRAPAQPTRGAAGSAGNGSEPRGRS
jgi:hypothetical protein